MSFPSTPAAPDVMLPKVTALVVVAPLPVTVARVSASVAVIVKVSPLTAVEAMPAPAIVKVSVVVLAATLPVSPATVAQRFWSTLGLALVIVIVPVPLAMVMPVPWVRVALVRVLPVVLPMSNCPLVYVVCPVPPWSTAMVVPCQVPALIVPRVVMLVVPAQVDRAVFSTLFNHRSVLTSA